MDPRHAYGRYGERIAEAHLRACGMQILDRNWRCALGEIDLVARDGDTLVIAEVKARRSLRYGSPAEAVTAAKSARLRRLASAWAAYARRNGTLPWFAQLRVDVLAVRPGPQGGVQVDHLRGVA